MDVRGTLLIDGNSMAVDERYRLYVAFLIDFNAGSEEIKEGLRRQK